MWLVIAIVIGIGLLCWLLIPRATKLENEDFEPPTAAPLQPSTSTLPRSGGSEKWLSKEEADAELVRGADGRFTFHIELRDGELRFVSDSSGKQPSPGNRALAKLGIFYVNVRGAKYHPATSVKVGSHVDLRREPNNDYDRNAIGVARVGAKSIYGYVNKGAAARIAKHIDEGEEFVGIVMGRSGITLAIMRSAVADELGLNSE